MLASRKPGSAAAREPEGDGEDGWGDAIGSPFTASARSRRNCSILSPSPDLAHSPGKSRATIGSAGSTASGSGTENTTFASDWPTCHPTVKSGRDWSIGFAKCITSVSAAGAAETQSIGLFQEVLPAHPSLPGSGA